MQFLDRLKASWPPESWRDVTVVVAVSGGADSVSLLCGLAELRAAEGAGKLIAAHFNHRLRAAADDDSRFVQQLAMKLGVDCEVGTATESVERRGSDCVDVEFLADAEIRAEAAARGKRYAFLLKTAQRVGARYVATAHTADDQAETILHRVLRGTGLAGLAGIPRIRALSEAAMLIRPLLECSRADVVEYLASRQQSFCTDESNSDISYTRNRIRHALLPQLAAQYNPNVREALRRLGQLAEDAQLIIRDRARELLQQAMLPGSQNHSALNGEVLSNEAPFLICEVLILLWKEQSWPLQQMGMAEWNAIAKLVTQPDSETHSLNLPGNIRAERTGMQLKLTRSQ